uniref:Uncharacterized protein n=1 Tax=Anguilla anguilla TaxID=7936 RepID=A0A0E9RFD3_ANGAN
MRKAVTIQLNLPLCSDFNCYSGPDILLDKSHMVGKHILSSIG